MAGGMPASRLARWDGTSWHTMNAGMETYVLALTEYQNDLYVGGNFETAGGISAPNIAQHGMLRAAERMVKYGTSRNSMEISLSVDNL